MYRSSAQVKCIPPNALPSPDNTSESDSEILDALDQKRRQLDDEIARFKAAKDREFREFEKELRVKRKRSHLPPLTSATAACLNLLASAQNGAVNGWSASKVKKDGFFNDKVKKPAPLSGPTLSLDRQNITGETTPPLNSLETPPTPSLLKPLRSGSPTTIITRPVTPPPSESEKEPVPTSTPTPSKDRSDPFAGVFTPAYLPLLDSRDQRPIVRTPPPLSVTEEEKKQLQQLDVETKQQAEEHRLESSQSLPPQQVSPRLVANSRTRSTPVLPSASLPSALRTSSGGVGERRRKHVMFQLADLKVVDPSSSYEEGPSPELEARGDGIESRLGNQDEGDNHTRKGDKTSNDSPRLLGEKQKQRGKGRGRSSARFISPIPSPLASPCPSPSPSPAVNGFPPLWSPIPSPGLPITNESPFSSGLTGAEDGGSSVGFFELDEELASPSLKDDNPADKFDLDVEDDTVIHHDDKDQALSEVNGTDTSGHQETTTTGLGIIPAVQIGSLPIDIVKPGSWVGSYGH